MCFVAAVTRRFAGVDENVSTEREASTAEVVANSPGSVGVTRVIG